MPLSVVPLSVVPPVPLGGVEIITGAAGMAVAVAANNNDQFIMDTLTTMRTDVNGIGRDQLIQTQQIGQGICQGFGGIATEIANLGSQLSQGQCRTEAAVLTTGLNGQI